MEHNFTDSNANTDNPSKTLVVNGIIYHRSKSHKILAGFIDLFFLFMVIDVFLALFVSILGQSIYNYFDFYIYMVFILLIYGIIITSVVIYHVKIAKVSKFLSPGELISSRIFLNGEKIWVNPYFTNRWALYILVFIILNRIEDYIGKMIEKDALSMLTILSRTFSAGIFIYALILIGKGKLKGVFIINFIFFLSIIILLFSGEQMLTEMYKTFAVIFSIVLICLFSVIAIPYYFIQKSRYEDEKEKISHFNQE